jgi:tetratricopeptide (TPR) repeat protein
MALRLISVASPTRPADLVAGAQSLLLAGDAAGYARLWREAAGIEDVHRRHQARTGLLEQAMATAGLVAPGRLPALYLAAAREALAVLEEEPREPVLLNLAAVALYELWALDGAEGLFRAAGRLDPELAHVEDNLAQVDRRRRAAASPRLPAAVAAELSALSRRADAVAGRARPATGLTLTLAMIVRDEEEMLPRCLAAIAPAVDEIVVVDTGSTDRTVAIAESFGARVLHHRWTGSFAEARNVSFEAATGDWVMYLDADEVLVADDVDALRALTGRTWREAFYLAETNFLGEEGDGTAVSHAALRVFRNRPEYRFDGRLHEQIADKLPGYLPERLEWTPVRVEHYGYLQVVRDAKEKSRRNIEILRAQMAETANPTPFLHFNLGAELAAAGEVHAAVAEFETAWAAVRADAALGAYGYVPSLASRLVKGLRAAGRLDEAWARGDEALELLPRFTDIVLEQGTIAHQRGEDRRAQELFERCLEMGDAPSRYTSIVGAGTFLALQALAQVHRGRGELERAQELLERALAEHPRYLGVVDPLAGVLLERGVAPADVVARVEAGVAEVTPSVRFLLGTALYEAAAAAEAEAQFAAVLARQPANGPARVALAEAQLSQADFAGAAATAAAIEPDNPCRPAALRSELFARLAGGDLPGAGAALAGASALAEAERRVFAAWLAAAQGAEAVALGAASVEPLAVALEALLRVEAFEAFEVLAGVLDDVALNPRQRRQLLAELYLRRGYVESAADEWLAACQETGVDGAALVGLAQVAVARGLPDDARVLAGEARTLAPDDPAAQRLAAALAVA